MSEIQIKILYDKIEKQHREIIELMSYNHAMRRKFEEEKKQLDNIIDSQTDTIRRLNRDLEKIQARGDRWK